MLRMIHNFVSLFVFTAVIFFIYEAGSQWFYHDRFKIRSIEEFGRDIDTASYSTVEATAQTVFSPSQWDLVSGLPAPAFFLMLAALFYLVFRLGCLLAGIKPDDLYKKRRRNG